MIGGDGHCYSLIILLTVTDNPTAYILSQIKQGVFIHYKYGSIYVTALALNDGSNSYVMMGMIRFNLNNSILGLIMNDISDSLD